ncbi:hypothetical protein HPP92_000280 [Vanilla planifolia]|uniref:Uncharacterized protein n=1 Tax=Vanilla planifolia TaxID=51239 RepID=A0A835SAD8_VANPL|nr:hypothetical protein HPP92_000280 [Vanilla planifolia]
MHDSKNSISKTKGNVLQRRKECSSAGHRLSWDRGRPQMASSSGSNEQTRTLNLTAVFVLAGAVLVFHLFASSVLLPFYKASFCGGYPNGSPILASSSATYEQTLQTTPATAVEDEIYVSPSSGSLPASQDSVINLDQ